MKKRNRNIIIGTAAGAAILTAASYSTAHCLYRNGVGRKDETGGKNRNRHPAKEVAAASGRQRIFYRSEIAEGIAWIKAQKCETLYTKSCDGLTLAADLISHEDAKGTVIAVHGYHGSAAEDMGCAIRHIYEAGYNVLMIDQRAHGRSEGEIISFGLNESSDICEWAGLVERRFGKERPVFLYGVSMGATSVLMAAGTDELPENVRGIIADCGYTSVERILSYVMKKAYHIPKFPVFNFAEAIFRKNTGSSFDEYDTVEAMENNTRPVLFIHGSEDRFVPVDMTEENYDACTTEKDILIVDGAQHAMSYYVNTKKYEEAMDRFLETNSR